MAITAMDKDRYYFKNGTLYANSDRQTTSVLIGSTADLEDNALKSLEPGTLAHTPGFKEVYELSPNKTWIKQTMTSGGGSGGNGTPVSDGTELGGMSAEERMALESEP